MGGPRSGHDVRAIVVGVDGSTGSKAALAFALEEGLVRGATVEVVTTWLLGPAISDIAIATTFEEEHDKAQACQDQALAEVLDGFGERPTISQVVLQSYGGQALVEAARDAALLVVGSGRKSVLARALLGSVSEYCVRHAQIPVVVVPDPARLAEHPAEHAGDDAVVRVGS
jgi:nucleotide-binding universal stress UspA family protein